MDAPFDLHGRHRHRTAHPTCLGSTSYCLVKSTLFLVPFYLSYFSVCLTVYIPLAICLLLYICVFVCASVSIYLFSFCPYPPALVSVTTCPPGISLAGRYFIYLFLYVCVITGTPLRTAGGVGGERTAVTPWQETLISLFVCLFCLFCVLARVRCGGGGKGGEGEKGGIVPSCFFLGSLTPL